MIQEHAKPDIDPVRESRENLLVVSFARSTSSSYRAAVAVAKSASRYEEESTTGELRHYAVFQKTHDEASRALSLLRYVSAYKSLLVFSNGRPVAKHWDVSKVLECFAVSSACSDYTAHCHTVLEDPLAEASRHGYHLSLSISLEAGKKDEERAPIRYLFPCRLLSQQFRFQIGHPALPTDQIQAGAVALGCNWCPHFDPKVFRRLPEQIRIGDQYLAVSDGEA